jgi:hypothetical protein
MSVIATRDERAFASIFRLVCVEQIAGPHLAQTQT